MDTLEVEEMNTSELLKQTAEENQTRKILDYIKKIAKEDETLSEVAERIAGKVQEKFLKD